MNSPGASFIDDIASQTTIKDYCDIRLVTIPGLSGLTESERSAIYHRAEQVHSAGPRFAQELADRLRDITPPLDDDDDECRSFEAEARRQLENQGCPPCYPPELLVPLRNPPEQYQPIVSYWRSLSWTDDVLCAQLSDWQSFRRFQAKTRAHYQKKYFHGFIRNVVERRQRHGFKGAVHLLPDPEEQSGLENWTEFHHYHLQRLERLQREHDDLKKELIQACKDVDAIKHLLDYAERSLRLHKVLLQWIEAQALIMASAAKASRRPTSGHDRERQSTTPAVLGKVRVSKARAETLVARKRGHSDRHACLGK